jgi:hypothetical protein
MSKIKLWYPNHLFNPDLSAFWFELLKSKQRFERDQRPVDAKIQEAIEWVDKEVEAEVYVLPLDWSYYYKHNLQDTAIDFCKQAKSEQKIVLSFSGNDFGITMPLPDNTLLYRQSGYRSKKKMNERTAPFYLSDPVSNFIKIEEATLFSNKKTDYPVIGFCGMAPHGLLIGWKEKIQILIRNGKSQFGFNPFDQQEIVSSSNLRFQVLETFKKAPDFQTNYIIRQSYRGGKQTPENRKKTTDEYYQNQLASDCIVCVRGVGNFSIRFFETLAMGRIPIFIDTDSPLPDIGNKDWNDYIVWIDRKDVNRAPEITKEWLCKRDIIEQKRKNRELWNTQFSLDQFWLGELDRLKSIRF